MGIGKCSTTIRSFGVKVIYNNTTSTRRRCEKYMHPISSILNGVGTYLILNKNEKIKV